jgi:two-component system, LuxR family, response regulator FixJ
MMTEPTVYIVDNDPAVLKSLCWLIESAHLTVKTFSSGESFLEQFDDDSPGCLILDVRMPGLNGLEVQERLNEQGAKIPVIVMTGYGEVPLCARAFKSGAFDFFEKPANEDALLSRIQEAIDRDVQRRRLAVEPSMFAANLAELTPRELDVMDMIVSGKTQKHIAAELGISIQTVAKHRARVLEKLEVDNDVELVRLVLKLRVTPA